MLREAETRPPAGPGAYQRRLADAGLSVDDDHQDRGLAVGAHRDRVQVGQLVVAADQARHRRGRRPGRRGELAAQDGEVQLGGLR